MADLVVTAASVLKGNSAATKSGTAGAAITAGMSVYLDTSGNLIGCEKDQTAAEAECVGIALNDAATGQPVEYQTRGEIDVGAVLTLGETYMVGAGAGGIAPVVDVIATEFATVIGVASAAGVLIMNITQSGVAHG